MGSDNVCPPRLVGANAPRAGSGRSFLRRFALLSYLLAPACAVQMDLPEGFLELEAPFYELKATTPDDAVLWVRAFDGPDGGTLDFWVEALRTDLVDRRHYRQDRDAYPVSAGGIEGRVMEFSTSVGGVSVGYLVGVWVEPGRIVVAEFCARMSEWERRIDGVRAGLPTLKF